MSKVDKFWQYAEEAMLGARHSKNETEKRALLDLARSWTQAALQSEGTIVVTASQEAAKTAKLALAEYSWGSASIFLLPAAIRPPAAASAIPALDRRVRPNTAKAPPPISTARATVCSELAR